VAILTSGHCPADALSRLCRAATASDVDGDKAPKAHNSVLPASDVQDRGRRGVPPQTSQEGPTANATTGQTSEAMNSMTDTR
jgi:hypothetical protein